jgi:hypothetical protein
MGRIASGGRIEKYILLCVSVVKFAVKYEEERYAD